jgi:hypothetical protein
MDMQVQIPPATKCFDVKSNFLNGHENPTVSKHLAKIRIKKSLFLSKDIEFLNLANSLKHLR